MFSFMLELGALKVLSGHIANLLWLTANFYEKRSFSQFSLDVTIEYFVGWHTRKMTLALSFF